MLNITFLDDRFKAFWILNKTDQYLSAKQISDKLLKVNETLSPKSITNLLRIEKRTINRKFLGKKKTNPVFGLHP